MATSNPRRIFAQYNFEPSDIADDNFEALYTERRRDSFFAFAYSRGTTCYALRDHLGGIPLYYRMVRDGVRFSTNLTDLSEEGDCLDSVGVQSYLKFGTTRLIPLVPSIGIIRPGTVVEFLPGQVPRQVYQYVLTPPRIPQHTPIGHLVEKLDQRMRRAVERVLVHDTVGLYLSGGIDSALIGHYLRELGVEVNAYTSAPWGKISSEIPYAQANAATIEAKAHFLVELDSSEYETLFSQLLQIYGGPHGTTTALGVTSIWMHTPIADEKQLFFGQNSDTVTCSVPAQYLTFFTNCLPAWLRRRIHPALMYEELIDRYLALGKKLIAENHLLPSLAMRGNPTALQRLTIAGMAIAHSPADSEVLSQPAIYRGHLVSNPYFDMDVVEFLLAIPLRHRIAISRKSPGYLTLEKRVLQQLALRFLPPDLVFRKKGFTVSLERDGTAQQFLASLPRQVQGVENETIEARFAAGVLQEWIRKTSSVELDIS